MKKTDKKNMHEEDKQKRKQMYVEGKQKRKEYMKKYGEKYRKNVGNISTKTCLKKTNQERTNIRKIGTKMCQTKKQDKQRKEEYIQKPKKITLQNVSEKCKQKHK